MSTNITGSTFDESKIIEIRRKLKLLEDLIFASNIKILEFEEEYKLFTNRKTFAPIPIRNGTKCFVSVIENNNAHILIDFNMYIISKKYLSINKF